MPILFQVYQVDSLWPTEGLTDASAILKFGFDRNPISDQAKQALARLLAVSVKAHFFLAPNAIVLHEPYLFVMPDLGQPGQRRYGLVYPLENEGRTLSLVVADWDLSLASSRQPKLSVSQKFPVVLQADPMQWVPLKHWRALKESAGTQPWFDTAHPAARQRWLREMRQHQEVSNFPYGHLLQYPKELNDDLKAVGALWAPGVRHWFLPKGWDVKAVTDYLDRLASLSAQERYALRWWTGLPYPRTATTADDDD